VVPQQPQYDQYDQYQQQPAQPGYGGYQPPSPSPSPPQSQFPSQPSSPLSFTAPPSDTPSAPLSAAPPSGPAARPRPRPEPQSEFEFDFDLDDDEPDAFAQSGVGSLATSATGSTPNPGMAPDAAFGGAPGAASDATPATGSAGGGSRTGDKDGYRPNDFDFVDEANDPDVGGWLEFSESRADTRAERLRRMRVRLIAVGVLVVLVAAGVGVYAWLGGSVPGLTQAQPTKSMILIRLDDSNGNSVGDALMVTNRGGSTNGSAGGTGAIVVIPAQMQIDDQGFGAQPFGGNMASEQPPAGSAEVSSALGVTPDGVWTIDETTFGIFVTELGGISLTANTAVPATSADPTGVSAGPGTLSGAQAVAYATYQASGESGSVQAARFGQVLEALMAKMPTYSNSVTAYLNLLALIPDPSLPLTKLSPILAALAAQQVAGRVTVATLPLSSDGSNTLNSASAAQIVSKLLGGTAKAGASAGQSARVLVQNATGASGQTAAQLVAAAQAKLVDSGYTYNAGSTVGSQARTVVEVASSSDQGLAQQVAASLGLSGSAVQVVSGLSSVDDVTVVLGQDWTSLSTQ
jgi:hypothetical protein